MATKTKTTKKEEKTTKKVVKSEPKKKVNKPKLKKNTQITDPLIYDVKENMKFEDVYEGEIPNPNVPGKFYKFNVYTNNEDGTVGDLIFEFDELMCFGINMGTDQKTGEPTGYSMSLSLMDKDKPTEEQKLRIKKLEEVIEFAKEFLVENRKVVKLPDLEMRDLKKFSPIYYKKDDDGNRIEGPPSLYPKLLEQKAKIVKKKNEDGEEEEVEEPSKILSIFYNIEDLDENGEPKELDPTLIIGKYCKVKPLIKIESIFVGQSIKLQVKVSEADVKLLQSTTRRLLHNKTKKDDGKVSKLLKSEEPDSENKEKKEEKKKDSPKKDSPKKEEPKESPKKEKKEEVKEKKKKKKEVKKEEDDDLLSMDD
jgi:hypothetical protein